MPMTKISPEDINALLPQTQCRECTYSGCLPYAQAILNNQEKTHLCKPGGIKTYQAIHNLLDIPSNSLGESIAEKNHISPSKVNIDPDQCIGCTKCIPACPVDAIVGSAKSMHYVIKDACTGCNLCIHVCPVDCISSSNHHTLPPQDFLKKQHKNKLERDEKKQHKKTKLLNKAVTQTQHSSDDVIAAALARAKLKRLSHEQATTD